MRSTTSLLYSSERSTSRKGIPSAAHTRMASSLSSRHVHSVNSGCHILMNAPTTLWPCCCSSAADTAESTPPDRPTNTVDMRPLYQNVKIKVRNDNVKSK